jgi:hypothetical protein
MSCYVLPTTENLNSVCEKCLNFVAANGWHALHSLKRIKLIFTCNHEKNSSSSLKHLTRIRICMVWGKLGRKIMCVILIEATGLKTAAWISL